MQSQAASPPPAAQEALAYLLAVLGEPGSVMSEQLWRCDWYWAAFVTCLRHTTHKARGSAAEAPASCVTGHACGCCMSGRRSLPCKHHDVHAREHGASKQVSFPGMGTECIGAAGPAGGVPRPATRAAGGGAPRAHQRPVGWWPVESPPAPYRPPAWSARSSSCRHPSGCSCPLCGAAPLAECQRGPNKAPGRGGRHARCDLA